MTIIFTDIDGVFNNINKLEWNKTSIHLYNKLCQEFDLKTVVTSTWRTNHTIYQLQNIFWNQGVENDIFDFTPVFPASGRGEEIEYWLKCNQWDNYIILDDNTRDMEATGLRNIVKCRGWIGFSEEEYQICRDILTKEKNPV
jgi:hypothetical protein